MSDALMGVLRVIREKAAAKLAVRSSYNLMENGNLSLEQATTVRCSRACLHGTRRRHSLTELRLTLPPPPLLHARRRLTRSATWRPTLPRSTPPRCATC